MLCNGEQQTELQQRPLSTRQFSHPLAPAFVPSIGTNFVVTLRSLRAVVVALIGAALLALATLPARPHQHLDALFGRGRVGARDVDFHDGH
eukprot:scaffold159049_cov27-Tisochrysis_lutea.AAC.2